MKIVTISLLFFIFGIVIDRYLISKENDKNIPRVTGVGGIFFKSKNPSELKKWYSKNLRLNTDEYGTSFEWYEGADSSKKAFTQWSPFNEDTKYFLPSEKDFMFNYIVHNLDDLIIHLKKNNVTILDTVETFEYGRFIHILDLENNKIELWEPISNEYDKIVNGRTK